MHPDLLSLLAAIDMPLALTSANRSGFPDVAAAEQVDPLLLAHCSLAIGPAPGSVVVAGVASTVVDLRPLAAGGEPVVLREGAVCGTEVLGRISACTRITSGILGSAFLEEEAKPIE